MVGGYGYAKTRDDFSSAKLRRKIPSLSNLTCLPRTIIEIIVSRRGSEKARLQSIFRTFVVLFPDFRIAGRYSGIFMPRSEFRHCILSQKSVLPESSFFLHFYINSYLSKCIMKNMRQPEKDEYFLLVPEVTKRPFDMHIKMPFGIIFKSALLFKELWFHVVQRET